jgi:hypothetical protein
MTTIQNAERTRKVLITRTMLSDGYNYYLTVLAFNPLVNGFVTVNYSQTETILSKQKAIEIAENLAG